jgi:hypothetical protein
MLNLKHMGNAMCNDKKIYCENSLKNDYEKIHCENSLKNDYEKIHCEYFETIKYLNDNVDVLKCRNTQYEERIYKLEELLDKSKLFHRKQIDAINEMVLTYKKKNINSVTQYERLKNYFMDFVDIDDSVHINSIIQNAPLLDFEKVNHDPLFDKSKFVLSMVVYYKMHFKQIIEYNWFENLIKNNLIK